MQNQTTAPERDLESLNPLIAGDCWNPDTAHNVRCAIEFMADAIPSIQHHGGFSRESATGCALLLRACVAAMEVTK